MMRIFGGQNATATDLRGQGPDVDWIRLIKRVLVPQDRSLRSGEREKSSDFVDHHAKGSSQDS